jgi:hypothetical protein
MATYICNKPCAVKCLHSTRHKVHEDCNAVGGIFDCPGCSVYKEIKTCKECKYYDVQYEFIGPIARYDHICTKHPIHLLSRGSDSASPPVIPSWCEEIRTEEIKYNTRGIRLRK